MKNTIPPDPAFPSLPDLLPRNGAPTFVAHMVQEMTAVPVGADQGHIRCFDYRPNRHCIVLWSLPTAFGPVIVSGTLFQDTEGAKIISDGGFQRLAQKAASAAEVRGRGYEYSPQHRLLLQIFPLDYQLPGLACAASQTWVRTAFARSLGAPLKAVRVLGPSLLAYKPSRRCLFGYLIEGAGTERKYFAKVLRGGRGQELLSRLEALRERLQRQGAPWDTVKPVTYFDEAQMLVLEALEGAADGRSLEIRAAGGDVESRRALLTLVAAAADGLQAFQRATIGGLDVIPARSILDDLIKDTCFLPGLLRVAPRAASAMEGLLRRLEDAMIRLPCESLGLGHGSFRHTHFFLRSDRPTLVDLDGMCLCGVNADAGKFLACLDRSSLRRPESCSVLGECESVFLGGLRGHPHLSHDWLTWHRAATLLKWALRSFSSLSYRWLEVTEQLVELSAHLLADLSAVREAVRAEKKTDLVQS
jgi:hypothetical protein